MGRIRDRSPGRCSEASCDSRARIQFRLPEAVLISPLWAMNRNGCASGQLGKVLVENRECTIAKAEAMRVSERSGKNGSSWLVVSIPLYTRVRADRLAKCTAAVCSIQIG